MQNFNFEEKFKILEYGDHSIILPSDGEYSFCMFFFSGFNENASKYIYLFKQFFEFMTIKLHIKVVIPLLPLYKDYGKYLKEPSKFKNIYSWYDFKLQDDKYVPIYNVENDNFIKELVRKELKILESSEKIIFCGFSQGGRYLLDILLSLKIKTMFNVIFKSAVSTQLTNIYKDEKDSIFNENKFYLYYSIHDKIVLFDNATKFIQLMKKEFKHIQIKIDNGNKHTIDYNCLSYLDIIMKKYLYSYRITKF